MWDGTGGEFRESFRDIQLNLCNLILYSCGRENLKEYIKTNYPSWNTSRLYAMCRHYKREGWEAFEP